MIKERSGCICGRFYVDDEITREIEKIARMSVNRY